MPNASPLVMVIPFCASVSLNSFPSGRHTRVRATANNGKLRAVKQGEAAADQQRAGVISDSL
nr:Uncharacterised protein [Klebsiella pneumoniae]